MYSCVFPCSVYICTNPSIVRFSDMYVVISSMTLSTNRLFLADFFMSDSRSFSIDGK